MSKFAEFEIWMVERLHCGAKPENGDVLIGQRLKAFRQAIGSRPDIVRNYERVRALLEQLQPYVELRSILAHARSTTVCTKDGETLHLFEIAPTCADHPWTGRRLIRGGELKRLQSGLASLVNQLKQQTPDAKANTCP